MLNLDKAAATPAFHTIKKRWAICGSSIPTGLHYSTS
jgi:hypothetical protein